MARSVFGYAIIAVLAGSSLLLAGCGEQPTPEKTSPVVTPVVVIETVEPTPEMVEEVVVMDETAPADETLPGDEEMADDTMVNAEIDAALVVDTEEPEME